MAAASLHSEAAILLSYVHCSCCSICVGGYVFGPGFVKCIMLLCIISSSTTWATPGFLERGVHMYKGVGVRLVDLFHFS